MKFRHKLMIMMISLISVFFGIGSAIIISISFNQIIDDEVEDKINKYEMIGEKINMLGITNFNSKDIDSVIDDYFNKEKDIVIINKNEDVIYAHNEHLFDETKVVDIIGEHKESTLCYRVIGEDNILKALLKEGKYYLLISSEYNVLNNDFDINVLYDISYVYENRNKYIYNYFIIYILIVVMSIFITYGLSYTITAPISKMVKTTRAISNGDFTKRNNLKQRDEIGELSRRFDKMADSIEDQMNRQNTFVANFTHEMKTPMTAIIGYADLIRERDLTEEEIYESANYIFKEAKRLERLSQKMLELIVLQNDNFRFIKRSPGKIIENIVEHLKPEYEKDNINIFIECDEGKCFIEPDYFESLIRNLLENAKRSFEEKGGEIYVLEKQTSNGCYIEIRDTGCGIPKEKLNRISEAFYRVDKSRSRKNGGAGLGLTLCRMIVELHKGTIEFQSEEGQGTQVIIELRKGI